MKSHGGVCIICNMAYEEYGHDAKLVAKGWCCNACNSKHIIPARLRAQRKPQLSTELALDKDQIQAIQDRWKDHNDNYDTMAEREMDLGDKFDHLLGE